MDRKWVFDWLQYLDAVRSVADQYQAQAGHDSTLGVSAVEPGDSETIAPEQLGEIVCNVVSSPDGLVGLAKRGQITVAQLTAVLLEPVALLQLYAELSDARRGYWREIATQETETRGKKNRPPAIPCEDEMSHLPVVPTSAQAALCWKTVFLAVAASVAVCLPLFGLVGSWLIDRVEAIPRPVAAVDKPSSPEHHAWVPLGVEQPNTLRSRPPVRPAGWRCGGLVVGVGDYLDTRIERLSTPRSRANEVSKWADKHFGADDSNMILLLDEQATEVAVRAAMVYLRQFSAPNDTILLYFCCHGVRGPDGKLRIQVHDSPKDDGLSLGDLQSLLGDSKAQIVVVADVCYAGAAVADVPSGKPIWLVLSSREYERAFEETKEGKTNFSSPWLVALTGEGDEDDNGVVTISEAFSWTVRRMEESNNGHHPQLVSPPGLDASKVVLSIHPKLEDSLAPSRGSLPPAPAIVTLTLLEKPEYQDEYKLTLDGVELGRLRQSREVFPVVDGPHRMDVDVHREVLRLPPGTHALGVTRSTPPWAVIDEPVSARWTGTIVAKAGESLEEQLVRLPPRGTVFRLKVVDPRGRGLFQKLVRTPATESVRVEPDEGTLRFEFSPQADTGSTLAACYISDPSRGIDVARLLNLAPGDPAVLEFNAWSESPNVPVRFFVGGVGGDSLTRAQSTTEKLPSDTWKTYEITLPASRLDHLVNGFGVEIDAASAGGQSVVIHVRDVHLTSQRSSE
ncbi:MAG: C13 family peptidase [Planctomycetota bacterium]